MQLEARIKEELEDIKKSSTQGEASKEYQELYKKHFKDGQLITNSGIETDVALRVVAEMEKSGDFVNFLKEALPIYYRMNMASLETLAKSGMIQEQTSGAGKGLKEQTAMVKAMSRFNWNDSNTKVILPEDIGNYSYTPMQGFEGETEQYFDGEKAWEEFEGQRK